MQGGFDGHVRSCPQAAAPKPSRDYPRLVDDQDIASPQQGRQVSDQMVRDSPAGLHLKQPGRIAWLRRPQGDAVFGKLKVEVRKLHGRR